jgi:hypothetical protein
MGEAQRQRAVAYGAGDALGCAGPDAARICLGWSSTATFASEEQHTGHATSLSQCATCGSDDGVTADACVSSWLLHKALARPLDPF